MMKSVWEWLSKPGAKTDTCATAPTQHADVFQDSAEAKATGHVGGSVTKAKHRRLDRWLDATVRAAGSTFVFLFITAGLVAWAFMGIRFHHVDNWQILMSDTQAILCYVYDSLLMRQQLNMYDESLVAAAELQSRAHSTFRMLQKVKIMQSTGELARTASRHEGDVKLGMDVDLPKESWIGRITTRLANFLGHVGFWAIYWAAIIVWLAFGHMNGWSNEWELEMNSATSALMVFVFAFLANIRELDCSYINSSLQHAFQTDATLERKLRQLTGDTLENDAVVIPAPRVNLVQRAIYYYSDVIGTLVGIALLLAVVAVWIAIGPLLQFGSNWWLLIGTYAGLIGLHDSFILRNVQAKFDEDETAQFREVEHTDARLFATAGLPMLEQTDTRKASLSHLISVFVSRVCAHELAVVVDLVAIIGLIVGSSVMRWNFTGQLLSNVPPSIIETFLMIVLINGHNSSDVERRIKMHSLYQRRRALLGFVEGLEPITGIDTAEAKALESPSKEAVLAVNANFDALRPSSD